MKWHPLIISLQYELREKKITPGCLGSLCKWSLFYYLILLATHQQPTTQLFNKTEIMSIICCVLLCDCLFALFNKIWLFWLFLILIDDYFFTISFFLKKKQKQKLYDFVSHKNMQIYLLLRKCFAFSNKNMTQISVRSSSKMGSCFHRCTKFFIANPTILQTKIKKWSAYNNNIRCR